MIELTPLLTSYPSKKKYEVEKQNKIKFNLKKLNFRFSKRDAMSSLASNLLLFVILLYEKYKKNIEMLNF